MFPFCSSEIYYPGLFGEIQILWSQDFPTVKIDLPYVWIFFFEERMTVKMCVPKKVALPENIWGQHLRRPTSLAHFRSIFSITIATANMSHELDPHNRNIHLKIFLSHSKYQTLIKGLILYGQDRKQMYTGQMWELGLQRNRLFSVAKIRLNEDMVVSVGQQISWGLNRTLLSFYKQ